MRGNEVATARVAIGACVAAGALSVLVLPWMMFTAGDARIGVVAVECFILHTGWEQETFQHLAGADAAVFCFYIFCCIADIVDHLQALIHGLIFLGEIAQFYSLSDLYCTGIRFYPAGMIFINVDFPLPFWPIIPTRSFFKRYR